MGSVTSALTRTRNALVKVGSEPENHDPERSQSAPESDRANSKDRKRATRFNVSNQTARQSSRQSLSEVLSRQDSDRAKQSSKKKAFESPQSGELHSMRLLYDIIAHNKEKLWRTTHTNATLRVTHSTVYPVIFMQIHFNFSKFHTELFCFPLIWQLQNTRGVYKR